MAVFPVRYVASSGKVGERCGTSERKFGIPFDNLHIKFWSLALFPQERAGSDAIEKRTSILAVTPLQRARDANELGLKGLACDANDRVAVTTHVHERNMRRQTRVRQCTSLRDVAAPCVFEARPDSVRRQQIHRRLGAVVSRTLPKKKGPQRMILGKTVLMCLYHSGCGNRTSAESYTDRCN